MVKILRIALIENKIHCAATRTVIMMGYVITIRKAEADNTRMIIITGYVITMKMVDAAAMERPEMAVDTEDAQDNRLNICGVFANAE